MDFLALIKDSHNTYTFSLLLFFSVLVHMLILEEDFVISVFLRSTRNSHFPHDILNFKKLDERRYLMKKICCGFLLRLTVLSAFDILSLGF